MGDRANAVVKDGKDTGVFIYTHRSGYVLPLKVQKALQKKWRWNDVQYLTRIIYDEVVRGHERTETGFGLTTTIWDNGHKIIVVDPDNSQVLFVPEPEESDCGIFDSPASHSWTFEEYISLSPEQINKAFNGD
jgi:hypothetical protein